jgi:hypothetical protein
MILSQIPEEHRTVDVCMTAVKKNGLAYRDVPEDSRTIELRIMAATQNKKVLESFTQLEIRRMLAWVYVRFDPNAIYYIPPDVCTIELWFMAMMQNTEIYGNMPDHLHTPENYLELVKLHGNMLSCVPMNMRTSEIYRAAFKQSADAVKCIPEHMYTPEMVQYVAFQDGKELMNLPEESYTREACFAAISRNPMAIIYVPEHLRTPELYMLAVTTNGTMIEHVPEHLRTPELCTKATNQNSSAFAYVPEQFRTVEMYAAQVIYDYGNFATVPEQFRTVEFYMLVVPKQPRLFTQIPEHLYTTELCKAAVQSCCDMLVHVPDSLLTVELCEFAVRYDAHAYQHVPLAMRTLSIAEIMADHTIAHETAAREGALDRVGYCFATLNLGGEIDSESAEMENTGIVAAARMSEIYITRMIELEAHTEHVIINQFSMQLVLEVLAFIMENGKNHHFCTHTGQRNWFLRLLDPETILPLYSSDAVVRPVTFVIAENAAEPTSQFIGQSAFAGPIMTNLPVNRPPWTLPNSFVGMHDEIPIVENAMVSGFLPYDETSIVTRHFFENTLSSVVRDIANDLGSHYPTVLLWVARVEAISNRIDTQVLMSAVRSLSDKEFREIAIPEIIGDNENCHDRTLMSVNKFYLAWCVYNISGPTVAIVDKLKVLLAGSKTVALRMAISEALKYSYVGESTETFLFFEMSLRDELDLITLATSMSHSWVSQTFSSIKIKDEVMKNYLKIAAEHPLIDQIIGDDVRAEITAIQNLYDAKLNVHIENAMHDVNDSQYMEMMRCYAEMVNSEILRIKMQWIARNATS